MVIDWYNRSINDIIREGAGLADSVPEADALPREGTSPPMQLCRLVQYFAKYLASVNQLRIDAQPHLYNELSGGIRKADTLWASMALARKILRFGPSINCVKTFILNTLQLIKGQNKESTPIFILKTLSALWIAIFFVCDHYLWLYRVPIHPPRWDSPTTTPSRSSSTTGASLAGSWTAGPDSSRTSSSTSNW
jgi:hypothetical protein